MPFQTVSVALEANAANYDRALAQAAQATRTFADQVNAAGERAGSAFSKAGSGAKEATGHVDRLRESLKSMVTVAAGFELANTFQIAATKIIDFAKEGIKGGVDLQQSIVRTRTIFGGAAQGMIDDFEKLGRQFGVADVQSQTLANTFGQMAHGAGLSRDQAAQVSEQLTVLTYNVAAFRRQSPEEVANSLSRGLLGVYRGLKSFGLAIDESKVGQEALRLGLVQTGQALTDQEKFIARASLITRGLGDAQGYLAYQSQHTLGGEIRASITRFQDWRDEIVAGALPAIQRLVEQGFALGRDAMPAIREAIRGLQPFFEGIGGAVENVWHLFVQLGRAVEPLAATLGRLALTGAIAGLDALGQTLKAVTGFLADHEPLVIGVAAAYTATLIPALVTSVTEFGALVATGVGVFFLEAVDAVTAFAAELTIADVAVGAATLGIGALVAAGVHLANEGKAAGAAYVDAIANKPAHSIDEMKAKLADLTAAHEHFARSNRNLDFHVPFVDLERIKANIQGYNDSAKASAALRNEIGNVQDIASRTGLSVDAILGKAKSMGIDLGRSFAASKNDRSAIVADFNGMAQAAGLTTDNFAKLGGAADDASKEVIKAVDAAAAQSGLSADQIAQRFGDDAAAIKAFGDAVTRSMSATASSWSSDADVVATVSQQLADDAKTRTDNQKKLADAGASANKTHEASVTSLNKAQQSLADLEARQAAKKTHTIADEQAHAHAVQAVADAQNKANDAAKGADITAVPAATARVTQFYQDAIKQASSFSANIQEATNRGLDPQLIARLLEAGPAQAAPVLQTILSDHSNNLIGIVNKSEQALQTLNTQAVEMARLTNIATHAGFDGIAADLSLAMRAAQVEAANGGKLTAQALADAIGSKVGDVQRIMQEYGITVADGINPILQAIGAKAIDLGGGAVGSVGVDAGGQNVGPVVVRRASGGVDPQVVHQPTVLFGERETGGEAFVPRYGDRGRAMSTLSVAAAWHGAQVVPMALGGIIPSPPDFAAFGLLGKGAAGADRQLYEAALAFMGSQRPQAGAVPIGAMGPVPPGSGTDWLTQAITLAHVPPEWLPGLYQIMLHESGGDPHAYNPILVGKEHAEGLMQMLPSTFASHAVGGHGDIWNPVDNALSAIGYIIGRYHDPYHTPGLQDLARSGHYSAYDGGGFLPPGISLAGNFTGRPEPVGHHLVGGADVVSAIGDLQQGLTQVVRHLAKTARPITQVFPEGTDPVHAARATEWALRG